MYVMHNPVTWTDPSGLNATNPNGGVILNPVGGGDGLSTGGGALLGGLLLTTLLNMFENLLTRPALSTRPAPSQSVAATHTGSNRNVTTIALEEGIMQALPGVLSRQQVAEMVIAITAVNVAHLENYRFFEAHVHNNVLTIGRLMTYSDAVEYVRSILDSNPPRGVFAFTRVDAEALANRFGGTLREEIGAGGKLGHFWHLHPVNRPRAHIWFLK